MGKKTEKELNEEYVKTGLLHLANPRKETESKDKDFITVNCCKENSFEDIFGMHFILDEDGNVHKERLLERIKRLLSKLKEGGRKNETIR